MENIFDERNTQFNQLAKEYDGLIHYYMNRFAGMDEDDKADLNQECLIGLYEAIPVYERKHEEAIQSGNESTVPLYTIAARQMMNRICDYICKMKFPVQINREIYLKMAKIRKYCEANPFASNEEIAKATNLSIKQVMTYCVGCVGVSLDTQIDEKRTIADYIPQECERLRQYPELELALDTLTKEEQDIIRPLFGIDCEKMSQSEIGDIYNITHQAISKKRKQILKKLADLLDSQKDELLSFN